MQVDPADLNVDEAQRNSSIVAAITHTHKAITLLPYSPLEVMNLS